MDEKKNSSKLLKYSILAISMVVAIIMLPKENIFELQNKLIVFIQDLIAVNQPFMATVKSYEKELLFAVVLILVLIIYIIYIDSKGVVRIVKFSLLALFVVVTINTAGKVGSTKTSYVLPEPTSFVPVSDNSVTNILTEETTYDEVKIDKDFVDWHLKNDYFFIEYKNNYLSWSNKRKAFYLSKYFADTEKKMIIQFYY